MRYINVFDTDAAGVPQPDDILFYGCVVGAERIR